jgi:hypothetical protein
MMKRKVDLLAAALLNSQEVPSDSDNPVRGRGNPQEW